MGYGLRLVEHAGTPDAVVVQRYLSAVHVTFDVPALAGPIFDLDTADVELLHHPSLEGDGHGSRTTEGAIKERQHEIELARAANDFAGCHNGTS